MGGKNTKSVSWRHWKRRLRRPLESFLMGCWLLIGPRLSRRSTVRLASWIGGLGYRYSKKMRTIGRANLDFVFGSKLSDEAKNDILRKSFFHSALTLLDIFWFSRHTQKRLETYVTMDERAKALELNRPIICITAHYGNWETMGQKVVASGQPLASVAQPLVNEFADRRFLKMRESIGQEIIPVQGAVRRMIRILKNKGRIALVMDQNTKPKDGGIFIPFFGANVPMSSAPATLALRTDAAIIFGFCFADEDGHYDIHVPAVIYDLPNQGSTEERIRFLTARIAGMIEDQIRRCPEPWVWTYKRWRHIEPGASPVQYPGYAKPLLPHEL